MHLDCKQMEGTLHDKSNTLCNLCIFYLKWSLHTLPLLLKVSKLRLLAQADLRETSLGTLWVLDLDTLQTMHFCNPHFCDDRWAIKSE